MTTENELTPSDIEELRKLEAAATPGPWWAKSRMILASDDRETIVCEITGAVSNPESMADRDLIVALRNTIDALLNEIEAGRSFYAHDEKRQHPVEKWDAEDRYAAARRATDAALEGR